MTLRDSCIAEHVQSMLLEDLVQLSTSSDPPIRSSALSTSLQGSSRPFEFSRDDNFRARLSYLNMENILVWGSNLMTESTPSSEKYLAAAEQLKSKLSLGTHHAIRAMLVYPSPFEVQVPMHELQLRSKVLSEVQLVHLSECEPSSDLPALDSAIKDPIPADPMASSELQGLCQRPIQGFLSSFEGIISQTSEETVLELLTLKIVATGLLFLQSTAMFRQLSSKIEATPTTSSIFPLLQTHLRFLILERTLIASLSAKLARVRAQNLPLREFVAESTMLIADYKVHQKHIQQNLVSLVSFRPKKDIQVSSGHLSIPQNTRKRSSRKPQKFGMHGHGLSLSQFSRRTDGPLEVIQESKVSEVSEVSKEPNSIKWDSFDEIEDAETVHKPRIAVSGPDDAYEPISVVVLPLPEDNPQEMSHDDLDLDDEVDMSQKIGLSSIKKEPNNSGLSQSFRPSNHFVNEVPIGISEKKQSQLLEPINPKKQDSMILSEDTEFSKEEFRDVSNSLQRNIGLPKSPQMRSVVHHSANSHMMQGPLNSNNSNQSNSKTLASSGSNLTARYDAAANNSKQAPPSAPKESGQVDSVMNTQNNQFTLGTQHQTVMQSPLRKPADVFDSAISESQELHPIQMVPSHESRMIYEHPKFTKMQPMSDIGNEPTISDPLSSGRDAPRSVFIPTENKNIPIMHHKMPRENSTKNLNLSQSGPLHGLQSMAFSESLTQLVRGREESAPTPAFMSGSINPKHMHEHPFQIATEPTGARVHLNQSQFADLPYSPVTKVTTPHFNLMGGNVEDFQESHVAKKPNIPRADRKNSHMHSSSIRNEEKSGQLDGSVIVGGWTQSPNNQHDTHSIKTMTTHTNNRHYMAIGLSSISRPAIQLDVDLSTYNSDYGNNQIGDDRTSATGLTGRGFIPMENPFSHYDDTAPSKTNVIENMGDKALALKALDTSSVFNPSCINGNFPSGMKPTPNTTGKTKRGNESYYQATEKHIDRGGRHTHTTANTRTDNSAKRVEEPQGAGILGISTVQQPRTIGSSLIPSESSLMVTRDQYHQNRSDLIGLEERRSFKPGSAIGSENMEGYDNMKFAMSVQHQQQSFKSRAVTTHHQLDLDDYEPNSHSKQNHPRFKDLQIGLPGEPVSNWQKVNNTPNSQSGLNRGNQSNKDAGEVESRDRLSMSTKQQWRAYGYYTHFGKQVAMNFSQLKCEVGGVIQGQGVDGNGGFGISGTIKNNREVQFTKQHLGMQPIAFKGVIDSTGSKIEGNWEYGGMQGMFLIEGTLLMNDQSSLEGAKAAGTPSSNTNSGLPSKSGLAPKITSSLVGLQEETANMKDGNKSSTITQKAGGETSSHGQEEESNHHTRKKNVLEISKSVNYADNSIKTPNESGPLNSIFRSSADHQKEQALGVGTRKADSVFYERDEEDLTSLPSPKFNGKKLGLLSNTVRIPAQHIQGAVTHMPKLQIPQKSDKEQMHELNFSAVNNISKRVSDTQRVSMIQPNMDSQTHLNTDRVSDLQDPPISKRCQSGSVDPNILSIMKHKEGLPHRAPSRMVGEGTNYMNPYAQDHSKEQEMVYDSLHAAPQIGHNPRLHMYPPIPRDMEYGSGKQAHVRFSNQSNEIRNSFAHHSGLSSSQLKPPHYHSFGPVYESGFTLGRKRGEDSRKSLEESGVSGRVAQAINRLVTKLSGSQPKSEALYIQKDVQRVKKMNLPPKIGSAELFNSMNDGLALDQNSGLEEDGPASEDVKILAEALALLVKDAGSNKHIKAELGFNSMVSGERDNGTQASPSSAKLEAELLQVREEATSYKKAMEEVTKIAESQDAKLHDYKETLLKSQKETESRIIQMMKTYHQQVEQLKGSLMGHDSVSASNINNRPVHQSTAAQTTPDLNTSPLQTATGFYSSMPVQNHTEQVRMSTPHFFTASNLVQSQPQEMQLHPMIRRSMEHPMSSMAMQQPMMANFTADNTAQNTGRRPSRQRITVGAKNLLDYYKEELDRKNLEIKECELNFKEEKRRAERLAEELTRNNRELNEKSSALSELEKQCDNLSKKNMVLNMSCERLRFSESVLAKDFDSLKQKYWRRSQTGSPSAAGKQFHKRGGSFDYFHEPQYKLEHNRYSHSSRRISSGSEDINTDDSRVKSGGKTLPSGFLNLLALQREHLSSNPFAKSSRKHSKSPNKNHNSPNKNILSKEKLKREVCMNYGDSLVFPFTKESGPHQSFVKELKKGQSLALMKKYAIDNGIKSFSKKAQRSNKEQVQRAAFIPKPPEDKTRVSSLSQKKSATFFESNQLAQKYPHPIQPKPKPS